MSFTNDSSASSVTFTKDETTTRDGYLQKEDTYYLLLENGMKIIVNEATPYSNETEPTTSFTNDSI